MEPRPEQDRTRKTFRMLAIAAGIWFLGSGVWGLLTETPADRASSGCQAAAAARTADSDGTVIQTLSREDPTGWFVAGEVRRAKDGATEVTHRWECTTDAEGRNPTITGWAPTA